MRTIPDDLRESLAGPSTTIARCWRLTRADGRAFGFTDHDEPLHFAGTRFEAATGLTAGEAETALGLSVGTQEIEGALFADAIEEEDIAAGLFDGARVESFAVDWTAPERHIRLQVSTVGEIRRAGQAFTAELRGPEAGLDATRGRTYRRRCDAGFGDERCGVDLPGRGFARDGTVLSAQVTSLVVTGIGEVERRLFERGRLVSTSGRNAGHSREVSGLESGEGAGEWRITLARPLPFASAAGDGVRFLAGCDKSFATCRDRFGNASNFRGFPHLPGLDAVLSVAREDELHDGSPLVP